MRLLVLLFLFTQNTFAGEGAHGFITYLQALCDGQTKQERVLFDQINKLDAFSFQKDILLRKMEQVKFNCLKSRLRDYAFKQNPTIQQILDHREYRVIFTQLALYAGALKAERSRTNFITQCNLVDPSKPNECTRQLSEKLVGEYCLLSAIERVLTAVGEAMDQSPWIRFNNIQKNIDREMIGEIKKLQARAKAAREFSLPATMR